MGERKKKGRKPVAKKTKGRKKKVKWPKIKIGPLEISIACFILFLLVLIPHLKRRSNDYGAYVPKDAFSYMMDVSHHQKHIAWDSLRVMTDPRGRTVRNPMDASRIKSLDYVVMKATEGENWQDDKFQEYWQKSAEAGLRRGAYHFFLPSKDPVKQARNFIKAVPALRHKDLAPVLDVETKPSSWSKEKFNTAVLRCLSELESYYERKPIVYAPDSFVTDIFNEEILSYPIWVAHYETESPEAKRWRYWQFTDKAVVYGVEGKVDLSVIN